jgi:CBS domain-containing protein
VLEPPVGALLTEFSGKASLSKDVVTVRQGTSLPAAADLMVAKKVSGLPVIDAEERLVGILTEADFVSAMNIDGGILANALETIVRKRRVRKGMGTIVDDIGEVRYGSEQLPAAERERRRALRRR